MLGMEGGGGAGGAESSWEASELRRGVLGVRLPGAPPGAAGRKRMLVSLAPDALRLFALPKEGAGAPGSAEETLAAQEAAKGGKEPDLTVACDAFLHRKGVTAGKANPKLVQVVLLCPRSCSPFWVVSPPLPHASHGGVPPPPLVQVVLLKSKSDGDGGGEDVVDLTADNPSEVRATHPPRQKGARIAPNPESEPQHHMLFGARARARASRIPSPRLPSAPIPAPKPRALASASLCCCRPPPQARFWLASLDLATRGKGPSTARESRVASLVAGNGTKGKAPSQLELWERCVCMVRATVTFLAAPRPGSPCSSDPTERPRPCLGDRGPGATPPHQTDQRRRA